MASQRLQSTFQATLRVSLPDFQGLLFWYEDHFFSDEQNQREMWNIIHDFLSNKGFTGKWRAFNTQSLEGKANFLVNSNILSIISWLNQDYVRRICLANFSSHFGSSENISEEEIIFYIFFFQKVSAPCGMALIHLVVVIRQRYI